MLVPIESISIVPAEPDNDLKFAASYATEEINHMSGIRPFIADPTLIPNSRYSIIIAWHNEEFNNPNKWPKRHGSTIDENNLSTLFEKLGFKLIVKKNNKHKMCGVCVFFIL